MKSVSAQVHWVKTNGYERGIEIGHAFNCTDWINAKKLAEVTITYLTPCFFSDFPHSTLFTANSNISYKILRLNVVTLSV